MTMIKLHSKPINHLHAVLIQKLLIIRALTKVMVKRSKSLKPTTSLKCYQEIPGLKKHDLSLPPLVNKSITQGEMLKGTSPFTLLPCSR